MQWKIALILGSMLLLLSTGMMVCDWTVIGSEELETKIFRTGRFEVLEIGNFFEAEIICGEERMISVTADDNMFDYIIVDEEDGIIRMGLEKNRTYKNVTLRATIIVPYIKNLVLSSGASAEISGFSDISNLELTLSGFSSLRMNNMTVANLSLSISSSDVHGVITTGDLNLGSTDFSNVVLSGSARNINAIASENSRLQLFDFNANDVEITLNNLSTASLNLSGRLNARVRNNSSLVYSGSPLLGEIDVDTISALLHENNNIELERVYYEDESK